MVLVDDKTKTICVSIFLVDFSKGVYEREMMHKKVGHKKNIFCVLFDSIHVLKPGFVVYEVAKRDITSKRTNLTSNLFKITNDDIFHIHH